MICFKCGKDKDESEFYFTPGGKRSKQCKGCQREYARKWDFKRKLASTSRYHPVTARNHQLFRILAAGTAVHKLSGSGTDGLD